MEKVGDLCKPMRVRGLGLRDVRCFNQALLAKQAWRLIKEPDSLLARVLLGKYGRGDNFQECSPKASCSWGQRSIMWGKELLLKGSAWKVGNGQHISVFVHDWIPRVQNPYVHGGKPFGIGNFKVTNLIDWRTFK